MSLVTHHFDPRDFAVLSFQHDSAHVKRSLWTEHKDPLAMLDGTMYSECSAFPLCASPDYMVHDTRTGVNIEGHHPTAGFTFSIMPDGSIAVLDGNRPLKGYMSAVQLYPDLIKKSKIVADPKLNNDFTFRAALGIDDKGMLVFAVGKGSMTAFSKDLLAAGIRFAGYTDGGGSASLVSHHQRYGSSENRAVALWFAELPMTRRIGKAGVATSVVSSSMPGLPVILGSIMGGGDTGGNNG